MESSKIAYQYDPLPTARSIRVLRLHNKHTWEPPLKCHVEILDLDDPAHESYCALSYPWEDPRAPVVIQYHHEVLNPNDPPDEQNYAVALVGSDTDPSDAYQRAEYDLECNGALLHVRKNLFDALRTLRVCSDVNLIWADAVCINQPDLAERSAQVAMMGDIYAEASILFAWLGQADLHSRRAMPLIHRMGDALGMKWDWTSSPFPLTTNLGQQPAFNDPRVFQALGIEPFTRTDWMSIVQFFRRAWFFRVWTVQESCLPKGRVVACGRQFCSYDCLVMFCDYVVSVGWTTRLNSLLPESSPMELSGIVSISNVLDKLIRGVSEIARQQLCDFLEDAYGSGDGEHELAAYTGFIVESSAARRCSDNRDRVFGMLGLATRLTSQSFKAPPKVDYSKSVEEVYCEFCRYLIETTRSLSIFGKVHHDEGDRPRNPDLPSWVVDFTGLERKALMGISHDRKFNACKQVKADLVRFAGNGRHIVLHGQMLTTVEQSYDAKLSERNKKSYDFVQHLRLVRDTFDSHTSPIDWLESFVHTMTAGLEEEKPEAEVAKLRQSFQHYMVFIVTMYQFRHKTADERSAYIDQICSLASSSKWCPSADTLRSWTEAYVANRSRATSDDDPEVYPFVMNAALYTNLMEHRCKGRAFMTTTNGTISLGPDSCVCGDEIWVLPGSRVPIVLRRSSNGNLSVVGDAYVYGYMRGEAFAEGGLCAENMETIVLE